MRSRNPFRKGIIFCCIMVALLLAALTDAISCETATCRARIAHTGTYSAVGLGASVLLDRYNGPDNKLLTFIEAIAVGAGIALIDEGMNGHGERFRNRRTQFGERALGVVIGAGTYQIFRWEF